jgi:hypothetical protein
MAIERASEAQRLIEHYSRMYDAELLRLADNADDLTEIARQVLGDEMKKRGLGESAPSATSVPASVALGRSAAVAIESSGRWGGPESVYSVDENETPHEFTWKVPLCECDDYTQAWQIAEVLRRAGIDCWIQAPKWHPTDPDGRRVTVGADQLEEARAIIAQPIPQDIIEESKVKVPEYEVPTCPHCGAPDPVLVSVDPVNAWACEVCEKEWNDPQGEPRESAGR